MSASVKCRGYEAYHIRHQTHVHVVLRDEDSRQLSAAAADSGGLCKQRIPVAGIHLAVRCRPTTCCCTSDAGVPPAGAPRSSVTQPQWRQPTNRVSFSSSSRSQFDVTGAQRPPRTRRSPGSSYQNKRAARHVMNRIVRQPC
jgi:hypothetical protein